MQWRDELNQPQEAYSGLCRSAQERSNFTPTTTSLWTGPILQRQRQRRENFLPRPFRSECWLQNQRFEASQRSRTGP